MLRNCMTPDQILQVAEERANDNDVAVPQYPYLKEALVGIADPWDSKGERPMRLVYDGNKCLEIYTKRDGMTHDDAAEHMSNNVEGGYLGLHTPIIVW